MATLTGFYHYDGGISDLTGLEAAVNLETLSFEGRVRCLDDECVYLDQISDLAPLSGLSRLEELEIYNYSITDIGPFQGLTSLKFLDLATNLVTDLSPLSGLDTLTRVILHDNLVADLGPLSGLTGLTELLLDNNLIVDLGPLSGLSGLEELTLRENLVADIGPLRGLTGLELLALGKNAVSDVRALSELTNLEWLELQSNSISNIDGLASLTNLVGLFLEDNSISDIGPLSAITSLERLSLADNSVSDLSALAGLTELSDLYLSNNSISEIGALSALSSASAMPFGGISTLDLSGNSILDVGPLAGASIWNLDLSGNSISDLSPLSGLRVNALDLSENSISNLGSLSGVSVGNEHQKGRIDLSDNSISDIQALSGMTLVGTLDLSNNSISDIDPLSEIVKQFRWGCFTYFNLGDVVSRDSLDLSNNLISDIGSLSGMVGACELDLSGNDIAAIDGLSALERVVKLNMSDNAVTDMGALSGLIAEELILSDNAIASLDSLSGIRVGDLDLTGNSIANLGSLSDMRIRYLNLTDNAISDLSALPGVGRLQRLDLAGNAISDLAPLSDTTSVLSMDLSRNELVDIGPLSGVTGLNWLMLHGNQITDIEPLVDNPGLAGPNFVWLGCCHPDSHFEERARTENGLTNPLSDVSINQHIPALTGRGVRVYFSPDDFIPVDFPDAQLRLAALQAGAGGLGVEYIVRADMARLTRLDASDRGIANLSGLEYASALEWLDLSDNAISYLGPLAALTGLRWLDLSGNAASSSGAALQPSGSGSLVSKIGAATLDIEPLASLVNLEWLDLSDTGLSDIAPLAALVKLKYLNLEGNAISDLAPIAKLEHLEELRLSGNPLSDESIAVHLPALRAAGVAVYGVVGEEVRRVVALFPGAGDALGRQGFLRVTNRSDTAGEVRIAPSDDSDMSHDSVTLSIGARSTVHFNSDDLEAGNSGKGLPAGTGPATGDWRLELTSDLDIEVLSYIRTGDGFLTSMHDVAPVTENTHRVVTFNPGSNVDQVSSLRLINTGDDEASVTIRGRDDQGASPGSDVTLSVPAGSARTVTAAELESGAGELQGALGDGAGKWSLTVESGQPLLVMSLLESPTGHLTNLSTAAAEAEEGTHMVNLFPGADDASGRQGFVRVINQSDTAGEVSIAAIDDTEWQYDPVTLSIGALATVHFNSDDLEMGNSRKGLSGSTGPGEGDWRLRLTSGLNLEVLSYIRTEDGFLTSMHDVAPFAENTHRVVIFNPGSNRNQVSLLRLVNAGDEEARVTIRGTDDNGESPGSDVELSVAADTARTLTAAELESGTEGLQGALGDGTGKWSLTVESQERITVMSLLESPTGHLTNLSSEGAGQ